MVFVRLYLRMELCYTLDFCYCKKLHWLDSRIHNCLTENSKQCQFHMLNEPLSYVMHPNQLLIACIGKWFQELRI